MHILTKDIHGRLNEDKRSITKVKNSSVWKKKKRMVTIIIIRKFSTSTYNLYLNQRTCLGRVLWWQTLLITLMAKFRNLNFYGIFWYYNRYNCFVLVTNKLLQYIHILCPPKKRQRETSWCHIFLSSFKLKTRILTLWDFTQNLFSERNWEIRLFLCNTLKDNGQKEGNNSCPIAALIAIYIPLSEEFVRKKEISDKFLISSHHSITLRQSQLKASPLLHL